MRTVTVDTRGLFFALKLLTCIVGLVALWYVWVPFQEVAFDGGVPRETLLSNVSQADATARTQAIHHLLQKKGTQNASVIAGSNRYVWVDVEERTVTLFSGEEQVTSFPIRALPDPSGNEALVAGVYMVRAKSAIETSEVTMARFTSVVQFGEGYAFHALATDAHGTTLASTTLPGGVVLAAGEAKSLMHFVATGTPVYVETLARAPRVVQHVSLKANTPLPATTARAYILYDLESGQEYLKKHETARLPIASVTKLFTARVAEKTLGHTQDVRAPNGEHFTLHELLYPLLLRSDNRVANELVAQSDNFIAYMNTYAQSLNLYDTGFVDASGLSDRDVSSARDLAYFARHLYTTAQYLLDITSENDMLITSVEGNKWHVTNQNELSSDPYFIGGKLGYTDEAQHTALMVFSVPIKNERRAVAVVVLGSKDWKQDVRALLKWLVASAQ